MRQQGGGTFLGLVLGLVVGLSIALVVAVYVTKVPIPFVFKGQSRTPEQDAAEATKNKGWDPNAPLQGKAASKATEVLPNPAKPPATAEPAAAKPENKPAVSADPLGELARAQAGGQAGTPAEPFIYFVQIGAFRTPEDAESQRAKLSLTGVEAKVLEREQSGRMVYRVRVGPFDKREDAEKVKARIEAAGHESALVRVQR
ncbi:MAG: SPOR domain-containing protein [Hylemonella sp.]|jgi:cell division protein FtsN